jgi:NAD(P)-dependent dehydrogenase (short-subunit alcohol dehydrogenase family)
MSGNTGRVTTPFGATSTAEEVVAGVDLAGRRAIVTGASSGIGVETVRALAGAGAEVTLAVRDTAAGERVAAEIGGKTDVRALDLGDLASVRAFTAGWQGPLHILVNNAGVMATPERRTPQGREWQFAVNHLGHFALTTGLHPALAAAEGARVVALSSIAHLRGGLDLDDLDFRTRPYDPALAYAQSKTATVLFAVEADRRWSADGITVNAAHPGAVLTNLTRHMAPGALDDAVNSGRYTFKTPAQGAATATLAATWPGLDGIGGRYFEDCNEAVPARPDFFGGVAAQALDPETAARLWTVSERLTAQ